nr:MAG: hypothetical protein [Bacteriophage sp.]
MKLRCIIGDKEMFIKNNFYKVLDSMEEAGVGTMYKIKPEFGKECFVPLDGGLWEFEIIKENEMNKEKLQEIASTMAKDEFIKKYHYNSSNCPGEYGLKESSEICNGSGNCTKCWENAIKELKFKEDNMKELNIIEASKMEVGTKFKVIKDGKEKKYTLLEDTEGKFFSLGIKGNSWSIAYSSLIQAKFIPLPKEIKENGTS